MREGRATSFRPPQVHSLVAADPLPPSFRQIVEDNSVYYVLGYESSNIRCDGRFRRIKVRMKRKGLNVRARDGYFVEFPQETDPYRLVDWSGRSLPPRKFEPRSDMPPGLTEAMASPVTLTTVPRP